MPIIGMCVKSLISPWPTMLKKRITSLNVMAGLSFANFPAVLVRQASTVYSLRESHGWSERLVWSSIGSFLHDAISWMLKTNSVTLWMLTRTAIRDLFTFIIDVSVILLDFYLIYFSPIKYLFLSNGQKTYFSRNTLTMIFSYHSVILR